MVTEIKEHLLNDIIPFWQRLRDDEYGGYYGWLGYDLELDKKAVKGCILNSRIMWFFANAYLLFGDECFLEEAKHSFLFMKEHCMDKRDGGVFWSIKYDGEPEDMTKHTYNQAFSIYALSSLYDATGDEEILDMAKELFHIVEEKCRDEIGYKEAFDREFHEIENEKLSENGVIADKTMNTLLHLLEAYTELYRVSKFPEAGARLRWILDTFADKVYNGDLHRLEVFFDRKMNPIIDLHSYGHDIEAAWLIDRAVEILGEKKYEDKMTPITRSLTEQIYQCAFDGRSLANECERGIVNTHRIWWVQAEAIVGFLNGSQKTPKRREYLNAAESIWQFVRDYVIDSREGSEWFWEVDENGKPFEGRPIVEPWKCPYHNGRMCLEVIKRRRKQICYCKSIMKNLKNTRN